MQSFFFWTQPEVSGVLLAFLTLSDADVSNSTVGDRFFEAFGPGNTRLEENRPYERFHDYEALLKILWSTDARKYEIIHKGTPFYFLAWTAFDIGNWEKGVFYMDAALSEDYRRDDRNWLEGSAAKLLLLQEDHGGPADRVASRLRRLVMNQIDRFNNVAAYPTTSIEQFVDGFVRPLVQQTPSNRSIVTALYTFILEYSDLRTQIHLRSSGGGSIEPFVVHLFKGGVILESILKHFYPVAQPPDQRSLGGVLNDLNGFLRDFPVAQPPKYSTNAGFLADITNPIAQDSFRVAFETTAKLRNTTGHRLTWDDVFADHYDRLFEQEMNAIFLVIHRHLRPAGTQSAGSPPAHAAAAPHTAPNLAGTPLTQTAQPTVETGTPPPPNITGQGGSNQGT